MSKIMPKHGILGFLIILISQLMILFKVPYFLDYYFPIIWFGYILLIDGLVRLIRGKSIFENKNEFIKLFLVSALFWLIFEFVITFIYNFQFIKTHNFSDIKYFILSTLSFSVVLPAIVETTDLANALGIFKRTNRRGSKLKLRKEFLYFVSFVGILLFLLPIYNSELLFPIFWVMFFLILDPINYINGQPSLIRSIMDGEYEILFSLIFAGLVCGFFWEFWNYWSYAKWNFMVPFFDFQRLFEMKLLGYIGLIFFTLELFAMYHFSRFLIKKFVPRTNIVHKFKRKKPAKVLEVKKVKKPVKKAPVKKAVKKTTTKKKTTAVKKPSKK